MTRGQIAGTALVICYLSTLIDPLVFGFGSVEAPHRLLKFMLVALAVAAAATAMDGRWPALRHPGGIALLAMPTVIAMSALWSPVGGDAIVHGVWYGAAGLTVLGAVLRLGPDRTNTVVLGVAAAATALGVALTAAPPSWVDTRTPQLGLDEVARAPWPRLGGLEGWYAPFAMTSVLLVIGAAVHAWRQRGGVAIAGLALGGAGIVASQSRQAAVAAMIGLAVALLADSRWRREALAVGLVATSAVIAAVVIGVRQVDAALAATGGLTGRTEVWEGAIDRFARRPWFGWGWGGLLEWADARAVDGFHPWRWIHAHSGPLEVLADFGVVGLLPLVLGAVVLIMRNDRVPAAGWGYLAALAVHSITEGFLWDAPATRWVIVSLALANVVRTPSSRPRIEVDAHALVSAEQAGADRG